MKDMKPHAALLASPGMGHIIPIVELGKCMVRHHGFCVTIFIVGDESSTALLNSQTLDNLDIVSFPPIDVSGIVGLDASLGAKLLMIMNKSLPLLRSAIYSMKSPPEMLIVDLFGPNAFAIAEEFGMLRYIFNTSTARFLAVTIYTPIAPKEQIEEHVKEHKPLEIPGCNPLRFEDTIDVFEYGNLLEFIQLGIAFSKADGILLNSWEGIESSTIEALRNAKLLGQAIKGTVYPVGPLVRQVIRSDISTHPVIDWLDGQPVESVIYVSFGSGGTMSAKQMTELAWGLELSRQRFVWVIRPPSDSDKSGTYFTIGQGSDFHLDYLPDGFVTRTRDTGMVVPMWAPQDHILNHPSVGGFLSHCGWNSTMESIINGVPMIGWPLYAEQKMNAAMLAEDVGVAIRPKQPPSESRVVGREEIEELVREIMVDEKGRAMRKKMKELKFSAEKALNEGGSSYNSLSQVAKECMQHMKARDFPLSI
ncbi:hypothetical protein SLE2022_361580 [Rubroshorea leprosula]